MSASLLPDRNDPGKILLLLLLVTDGSMIFLHLIHIYTPFLHSKFWSITHDRGIGEIFQYVKEYWIAIMLGVLAWRRRERLYGTWSLLYFYLLGDDALQFHERGGEVLVTYFGWKDALDLHGQDFGELAVSAIAGFLFLLLITASYSSSASEDAKKSSRDLTVLLAALVFCGIFLDMLHSALGGSANNFLGMLEDGGELVVMSVTAWYVFNLMRTEGKVLLSIWDTVVVYGYRRFKTFCGLRV